MAEVLVLAELNPAGGGVRKTTLEALTAARALGEHSAVVLGAPGTAAGVRDQLAEYGGATVYVAESAEEELVMYADKFHSKRNPPVFFSADSYAASVARFGEDKVTRFKELRTRFGVPDLAPLVAAHGHALV